MGFAVRTVPHLLQDRLAKDQHEALNGAVDLAR
jgi:hypothetical protein